MKPKFQKAVDSGDIEGVRISLSNEMMLDPRGESFNEMRTYAEAALQNLYEPHNGEILDNNKEAWNRELLNATRNALDDNFSKERLDYYFNVAKVVLKDKADSLDQEDSKASMDSTSQVPSSGYSSDRKIKVKPLSACLTIGGLVLGSSGIILGRSILTALGIVGIAIGGYQLYNDNKK